ncbi:MAG: hypothetical protein AAFZ04_16090 [Pseudomonadota bacterium]
MTWEKHVTDAGAGPHRDAREFRHDAGSWFLDLARCAANRSFSGGVLGEEELP